MVDGKVDQMQARHKLTAAFIKSAPPGKHCDGGGLWFVKRRDGGGQWVFRYTWGQRRPEMGLGSQADVTLKQARENAANARALLAQGKSPIKERERKTREANRISMTLENIAAGAFEARKAELKDDGKAGRWFSPLELHVLPKLGGLPIEDIDQRDLRDALGPIWHDKAATAKKALNRLSIVFRHAAALGLDVDLQATDKARALLGKQRHETIHVPAMPWRDVPDFYSSISEPIVTHLALRLLILTGLRSKPIRFCRPQDIVADIWTVPAADMKGQKHRTQEFRVPLSNEALRVIELAKPFARNGFLFPSARKGVISDATMSRMMERRGLSARPHGFRTSLRTWLAEETDAPHEVAETVLGHTVDSAVVRAYRRTDYIEQRRVLMEKWAGHVASDGLGRT